MLPFSEFRDNWLTPKETELISRALETKELSVKNAESIAATAAASVSLFILAEYHEWLACQANQ